MFQVYVFTKYDMFDMFDITMHVHLYETSPRHMSIGRDNLLWQVWWSHPTFFISMLLLMS